MQCKKKTLEPTPLSNITTTQPTFTYSHYILSGNRTIVIHFNEDVTSNAYPLIGDNEIRVNGSLVTSTLKVDSVGSVKYYIGLVTTTIHLGDTIDIKNMKLPARNKIYSNSVLKVDTSSTTILNTRYIVN